MTSVLNLYITEIVPWKNFKIDDLVQYLNSLASSKKATISPYQYIKHSLDLKIKIEKNQEYLYFRDDQNFNYCSITNSLIDMTPVYYFITGKRWLSEDVMELTLRMDVVNSFYDTLSISNRTTILREHKNRWLKTSTSNVYLPNIDLYSEGITPILYKTNEEIIYSKYLDNSEETDNFYLIYRSNTTDITAPLDVYLCAGRSLSIDFGSSGYSGYINLLNNPSYGSETFLRGLIYGLDTYLGHNNIGSSFSFYDKDGNLIERTITSGNQVIIFDISRIRFGYTDSNGFHQQEVWAPKLNQKFSQVRVFGVYKIRLYRAFIYIPGNITPSYISDLGTDPNITPDSGTHVIGSISDIDRTDPLLLKIIKLPYCPTSLDVRNGNYIVGSDFGYQDAVGSFPAMLKYKFKNTPGCFSNIILSNTDTPTNYLSPKTINMSYKSNKNFEYETKLHHSDYYAPYIVYDSFSYAIKLEELNTYSTSNRKVNFYYYVSSTMSSKFMISLMNYQLKLDTENYSNILAVSRNNEVPIYDSSYMDYIKTGYNYDVKTKNRANRTAIATTAIGLAGSIGAFALGPAGAVAGVGLATGTLASLVNVVSSTAQNEQNIQQKLKTAEMQGLSVSGSDDVELMTVYTNGNKAKIVYYEITEKMKKALFDLFYFTGYVANYQGKPFVNSRVNFNFLSADVVFDSVPNLPKDIVEEIVLKFKEGITFLHKYTNDWDFAQVYENWESFTPHINENIYGVVNVNKEYVFKNAPGGTGSTTIGTGNGTIICRLRDKTSLNITNEYTGVENLTINFTSRKIIFWGYDEQEEYFSITKTFTELTTGLVYLTFEINADEHSGLSQLAINAIKGQIDY